MKTIERILIVLFVLLIATSCGSSSPADNSGSGSESKPSESSKEDNKPKEPVLAYEITDVINNIYEADYGMGTKFNVIIEVQNTGDVALYMKDEES